MSSNLPPGCGKIPGEEESPCELCGLFPDACICPECECGEVGAPRCYEKHGMTRNQAQIDSLKTQQAKWEESNRVQYEIENRLANEEGSNDKL